MCRKERLQPLLNLLDPPDAVQFGEQAALTVIRDEGSRLLLVDGEPRLDGFPPIVGPLDEAIATAIARHVLLRRSELDMIHRLAHRTAPSAGQASHDFVAGNRHVDDAIERGSL